MTGSVQLVSPIDGSVYLERDYASQADIDRAVLRAGLAQKKWSQLSVAARGAAMTRFLKALQEMNSEIVTELAWQMGRPVRYGGEISGVNERAEHLISIAADALKPIEKPDVSNSMRYITREPLGVVMVIAPWNYPFLTAINTIIPALMAGNAVILKHASQTLLVGERFAQAMAAADLPAGLFQNLVMDHQQTEALLGSGKIDHINFTGSVEGGRRIERAAAGTFASLGLELGGKDPAYVREDADVDFAIANLVDGAFFNSGQCCCGIERIYVHKNVYENFVAGFVALTKEYVLGDPLDSATSLGPMAHARFADLVREQIAEALRKGATGHISLAHPFDKPGSPYLAPQVLTEVNHQMSVMREESFGPVVGIMPVADDDDAVDLMNDSPYGLTASFWTRDTDRVAELGARLETGTVFMNRCDYVDPGLVWTGVKATGKGAGLSEIGYHSLTRPKSFHLRRSPD